MSEFVQFVVGRNHGQEKTFSASKSSLDNASPMFRAMFYGDATQTDTCVIRADDVLPDAFSNLLSHVQCREDPLANLSPHNVFATMNIALEYHLPALLQHCCEYVSRSLRASNCLLFLDSAVRLGAAECVDACWELVDTYIEVLFLDDFTALQQDTLIMLLRRDTLVVDENNVYRAAEKWAFAACARKNLDPTAANRRQVLGEAFYLIRFPLLTSDLLTIASMKMGLLSQKELSDINHYKNATIKPPLQFPTAPRQASVSRIGGVELRHNEPVFVNQGAECWLPAKVIAGRPAARCCVAVC
ncbi:BTB/POZ domain-containing protein 6-B-like [Paramacrobiotus metropolitanus]|uniref:BTB/POZ domain-containing protein 6-B-like n=1 Tax=Paramacrobiotus metropolitanus TaxID=2943436 RepID=UPI002445ECC0|nr:BTB/POZ domain-containing protein 6-B-like [Paramacrobiotus metropolitanus]